VRLITRTILYALSSISILFSLYFSNIPVAAKEFPQNSLPASGQRYISPREYLYLHAGKDATILDRMIKCESGWNPEARNKDSTATGLGQFLNSTWITTRKRMGYPTYSLDDRTNSTIMLDTMIWLYQHDGQRHWLESKPCWGR